MLESYSMNLFGSWVMQGELVGKCQFHFMLEFRKKRRSNGWNMAPLALRYHVLREQSENLIKGLKIQLYILEDRVYFAMTIKISSFLTRGFPKRIKYV
uniref:Putative ovule protein n=1 Tax=Solanum chacoense TaxID=4108 RepID=A0A0V0HRN5_SOLCH